MNENDRRQREHLAAMEMIRAAETLNRAHSNLLMRRFDQAKRALFRLRDTVLETIKVIPEEDKG